MRAVRHVCSIGGLQSQGENCKWLCHQYSCHQVAPGPGPGSLSVPCWILPGQAAPLATGLTPGCEEQPHVRRLSPVWHCPSLAPLCCPRAGHPSLLRAPALSTIRTTLFALSLLSPTSTLCLLPSFFGFCLVTVLLRCYSHTVQVTHLKCTVQYP